MSKGILTAPVGADDHAQGPENAPITLVEYGDYECPHCARAHPVVLQIQRHLGDTMRFVLGTFRSGKHTRMPSTRPKPRNRSRSTPARTLSGRCTI
jgi:Thioredoxin